MKRLRYVDTRQPFDFELRDAALLIAELKQRGYDVDLSDVIKAHRCYSQEYWAAGWLAFDPKGVPEIIDTMLSDGMLVDLEP